MFPPLPSAPSKLWRRSMPHQEWSVASLGVNLFKRDFYTLSAWENAESLKRFVHDADHLASLTQFKNDMRRKSIFVYYKVPGRDLPLTWADAIARQETQDKMPS